MAFNTLTEMLSSQLIALAWIRCLQEEGVDFVNKETGEVEKDERVIYEAFENETGAFDMPMAKGSRWGLEKNIIEVYGSYILYNENEQLDQVFISSEMRDIIRSKIETIREAK